MPTYSYKCTSCGHLQDEFHAISATPDISCKECGSKSEKIFTPTTNFVLKGDGWPTMNDKMKRDMKAKNSKMKGKMRDRERSGEGVSSISDLKKVS